MKRIVFSFLLLFSLNSLLFSNNEIPVLNNDTKQITVCVNAVFVEVCWTMECKVAPGPPGFRCHMDTPVIQGGNGVNSILELAQALETRNNMPSGSLKTIELTNSSIVEYDGKNYHIKNGSYTLSDDQRTLIDVNLVAVE